MNRQATIRGHFAHALRSLAAFAIAVQFLVPAGYMPGRMADGTPFVFCHALTAALPARLVPEAVRSQAGAPRGDDAGNAAAPVAAHGTTDSTGAGHAAAHGATHAATHGAGAGDAADHSAGQSLNHSSNHEPNPDSHEQHSGSEAWEHCPLGALSATPALATALVADVVSLGAERSPAYTPSLHSTRQALTARARAPPVALPHAFA